ncbi:MAG: tRNA epoxyqueuosine(34) reductase QueG [Gemmatimonadetes bacterium]|nr:tRNA epoxyqueuosine(34) reductase QueG [Gemmatimonadota bacterium]
MTIGGEHPKQTIRRTALELGFSSIGFAPADRPAHRSAYLEWLRLGRHADMGWMAREDSVRRRLDPTEALPGCRTVVVVSLSYAPPSAAVPVADPRSFAASPDSDPGRSTGDAVIARYALGRDYHDVFEEKLAALAEQIRTLDPEAGCKLYVDYGPVLEREHAQRAGLGWIGKNTLLINPELGSYLLLGEILTTLDLAPDAPFLPDRCGTCTRCIEACPTDAIVSPRVLDARRCISWLTIENRGPIPLELRTAIGNRVFGCDICQEVCPWNRDPAAGDSGDLDLGRPVAPATLRAWTEELVEMDTEEFRARYGDTALARPGREGLLRNLCVGLGNAGDERAVPLLQRCAADESELVRDHARWALSRLS